MRINATPVRTARMLRCLQRVLLLLWFGASFAAADSVCDLDQAADTQLQQRLLDLVEAQGLAPATRRGALAVSLLVLTDPNHQRLAQVNGHRMF